MRAKIPPFEGTSSHESRTNRKVPLENILTNLENRTSKGSQCCRQKGLISLTSGLSSKTKRFAGLFTQLPLKKGSFIGFYCGLKSKKSVVAKNNKNNKNNNTNYNLTVLNSDNSSRPALVLKAFPNMMQDDFMGYINEPPPGESANLTMVKFFTYSPYFKLPLTMSIALYANKNISVQHNRPTELFVHYGEGYEAIRKRKGYTVGGKGNDIAARFLEDPREAGLEKIPLSCTFALSQEEGLRAQAENGMQVPKPAATQKVKKAPVGRPPKGQRWCKTSGKFIPL
jgi:hypothetical protein